MRIGDELKRELGCGDVAFDQAVRQALDGLETEDRPVKKKMGFGLVMAIVLTLMLGVTALAAGSGWSMLLERLLGTSDAPEAVRLVQVGENELCSNANVCFVVREKIYDGYGLYLAVDVFPAREDVLLLGWDGFMDKEVRPDSPAAVLGAEHAENMTVAEYCEANGMRMQQVYATIYSPALKEASPATKHSIVNNPDGSLTFVLTGGFTGDPTDLGIQCVSIAIDNDMTGEVWYENVPLHITLAEDAVRKEKSWTGSVLAAGEADLRLEKMCAVRTPIGCYLDLAWSTNDETPEWFETSTGMTQLHYFTLMDSLHQTWNRPFGVENTPDKCSPAGRRSYHTVWPLAPGTQLPDKVDITLMRSAMQYGVLMGEEQGTFTLELK